MSHSSRAIEPLIRSFRAVSCRQSSWRTLQTLCRDARVSHQPIRTYSHCSSRARPNNIPTSTIALRNSRAVPIRSFTSTPRRSYKTVEEAKTRGKLGPLTLKAGVLFVAVGVGIIFYFREERSRLERKKIAEQTKGIGKPKVGGPFSLIDNDGNKFTDRDMRGKYALMYFGFTHCPDICPDELDKMAEMIDGVKAACGDVLLPVMITCDPARDKPAILKEYLQEFHPDIVGLTGEYEDIKSVCKEYRVYFSTPLKIDPRQDYLVDHSIYFYLMDPDGDFVEALGRNFTAEQATKVMVNHIKDWQGKLDRTPRRRKDAASS